MSQLHKLQETEIDGGEPRVLGGALNGLTIYATHAALDEIEVVPAEEEQLTQLEWPGKYVRLTLAGRQVWLDAQEAEAVIELLQLALKAATENLGR